MNARVGLAGNHHYLSALFSFNTLRTHSPSSFTDFSSDLDTEVCLLRCLFLFFFCLSVCVCVREARK